ncbi:MAG: hypothetical protein WDZ35_01200 [Crocinitomicaceae bacterium]
MTNSESFEKSFQYYLDHKEELLDKYRGKVIAIYENKILGAFKSKKDAYLKVPEQHNVEIGSFLIKMCEDQDDESNRVYHSNVVFSND